MASDASYYPYEYLNQFSKLEGFDIDLAEALSKKLDKTLVIKSIPFNEQNEALQKGKIDILLNGMTITPEREKEFILIPYHHDPVRNYFLAFWKSIPKEIHSIKDFKNYPKLTISAQKGTLKADYLASLKGISFKTRNKTKRLFFDLNRGKTTALLLEPEEAYYIQDRHPNLRLLEVPLPKEKWTDEMGIAIKKGNVKMQAEITKALKELKEEGVMRDLEHGWFKRLKKG